MGGEKRGRKQEGGKEKKEGQRRRNKKEERKEGRGKRDKLVWREEGKRKGIRREQWERGKREWREWAPKINEKKPEGVTMLISRISHQIWKTHSGRLIFVCNSVMCKGVGIILVCLHN